MMKFENEKNAQLIGNYLKQDVMLDSEGIVLEELAGFAAFEAEIAKVPVGDRSAVLTGMMTEYELKGPIKRLFNKYGPGDDGVPQESIPLAAQVAFDALMLEVTREFTGAQISKDGKIHFNRKAFSDFILQLYSLIVNRKDPDTLLVYDKSNGLWEDATIALNRLIIEVAHYSGGNVLDSWNGHLEKMLEDILLRKVELVNHQKFNQRFFPFSNATLDSETAHMVTHSANHLATIGSTVSYDPDSVCPTFKKFLNEVFEDPDTIQFVQEWFGYVLCSSHKANALLIGVGAGANGKSTLFDLLAQLVGVANVSSAPLANFNSDFGLEPLLGMKLNLATESDADAFKTGKLKAITAGEPISVNRKNKQEITVTLPTKLVFLVNELPILSDSSLGFERRLIILPFNKTFTPEEQDKDLPKKLKAELEGILNWALVGLARLIKNDYKFTCSSAIKDAKKVYIGVGNPVGRFVKECVVQEPAHAIESNEVLNAYRLWMICQGYPFKGTDSSQVFWREFDEAARKELIEYHKKKSNGKTMVRDIALRTQL